MRLPDTSGRRTRMGNKARVMLGSDLIRELHDPQTRQLRKPAIVGDQRGTTDVQRRSDLQRVGRAQRAVQRPQLCGSAKLGSIQPHQPNASSSGEQRLVALRQRQIGRPVRHDQHLEQRDRGCDDLPLPAVRLRSSSGSRPSCCARTTALRLAAELDRPGGWPRDQVLKVYHELGDDARRGALARRIDALPAGPAILARLTAFDGNALVFDLADTPNFAARLAEAGIDPAGFQPMPRLSVRPEDR